MIIAKDLETLGLAWMPTISYDTQAVLAGDKVRFHRQEVAFVIATDAYAAPDTLQLIDVDYDVLPAIVNARKALDPDAPPIRDDKVGRPTTWRARCNDIGGGFGNKVPVYPRYVCAIAGSIVAGAPVKWIEDRSENLVSTGFARDYVMHAEMCAADGRIKCLRVDTIADHGAFDSTAQATKFPKRAAPQRRATAVARRRLTPPRAAAVIPADPAARSGASAGPPWAPADLDVLLGGTQPFRRPRPAAPRSTRRARSRRHEQTPR